MANNVFLSAGIQQNVLTLQSINSSINTTQNALATGKKVNSAIDNPLSYFQSQNLYSRASDLNGLLDSMGQAVQTVKAASTGIDAITALVKQAQGLAQAAQSTADTTQRSSYATQYNALLTQIDQLAADSGYQGINLLGGGSGNNLVVQFNAAGTSNLTISAVDASSTGLSINTATNSWATSADISSSMSQLATALNSLRADATTLGANIGIVQARQDFTNNLINVLNNGADALVAADPNKEGATLLALQTRQQISISALGIAVQSNQAILKLL